MGSGGRRRNVLARLSDPGGVQDRRALPNWPAILSGGRPHCSHMRANAEVVFRTRPLPPRILCPGGDELLLAPGSPARSLAPAGLLFGAPGRPIGSHPLADCLTGLGGHPLALGGPLELSRPRGDGVMASRAPPFSLSGAAISWRPSRGQAHGNRATLRVNRD